jgi:hypothetical protein
VNSRINIGGARNTIQRAVVTALSPAAAKANKSTGNVITRPPPINTVRMYWLQDIRKTNREPVTIPGRMAGKVT